MEQILALSLAATTIVKVLIDVLRLGVSTPTWAPPLLAVVGGPVIVLLLMMANAQGLTQQALAQAILAGILAGGGAVGVTEISRRTLPGSK